MPSTILSYHSLDASDSPISTSPILFLEHMARLAESGAKVVPLERIAATEGGVALTFDWGFANFLDFALPVLQHYGFPATVFVVTGYCGDRNRWDRRAEVPKLRLMDWDDLKGLPRPLIQIGSQTVNHLNLARSSPAIAALELDASREAIAHVTGAAPTALAFPYGATSPEVRELAASRFQVACGSRLDYVDTGDDLLALPRIDAFFLQDPRLVAETVAGHRRWTIGFQRMLREMHALIRSAS